MIEQTYKKVIESKTDPKRIKFLRLLHEYHKIPLDLLDVNDWQCNTRPSVYVHNRKNRFKMKRNYRCSVYDIEQSLKFLRGTK